VKLFEYADKLFSKLARISRADKSGSVDCFICGSPFHWSFTDCAHFIIRRNFSLRYCLDNCWPVCRICHQRQEHNAEYESALLKKKGAAFVESLRQRGNQYFRTPNDKEMAEIIEEITQELNQFKFIDNADK
jgi:hypothetical protein